MLLLTQKRTKDKREEGGKGKRKTRKGEGRREGGKEGVGKKGRKEGNPPFPHIYSQLNIF